MSSPLRKYRERNSLTQQQLAELLKCSRGLVSLIETGEREITPENAKAWEPKLGIPRERLCAIFRREAA